MAFPLLPSLLSLPVKTRVDAGEPPDSAGVLAAAVAVAGESTRESSCGVTTAVAADPEPARWNSSDLGMAVLALPAAAAAAVLRPAPPMLLAGLLGLEEERSSSALPGSGAPVRWMGGSKLARLLLVLRLVRAADAVPGPGAAEAACARPARASGTAIAPGATFGDAAGAVAMAGRPNCGVALEGG